MVSSGGLKSPTLNSLLYGASTANEIVNAFAMNANFVNQGAIDSASINSGRVGEIRAVFCSSVDDFNQLFRFYFLAPVLLDSSSQPHTLSSSSSSSSEAAGAASSTDISISAEAVEALRAAVPEIIQNISHTLNKEAIENLVQMASQVVDAAAAVDSSLPQLHPQPPPHEASPHAPSPNLSATPQDLTSLVTAFSSSLSQHQPQQPPQHPALPSSSASSALRVPTPNHHSKHSTSSSSSADQSTSSSRTPQLDSSPAVPPPPLPSAGLRNSSSYAPDSSSSASDFSLKHHLSDSSQPSTSPAKKRSRTSAEGEIGAEPSQCSSDTLPASSLNHSSSSASASSPCSNSKLSAEPTTNAKRNVENSEDLTRLPIHQHQQPNFPSPASQQRASSSSLSASIAGDSPSSITNLRGINT